MQLAIITLKSALLPVQLLITNINRFKQILQIQYTSWLKYIIRISLWQEIHGMDS